MRTTRRTRLVVALVFVGGLSLLTHPVLAPWQASARPTAGAGDKKVDVKTVSLDTIFATSKQKGLKVLDRGQGDAGFSNEMEELHQAAIKVGASNVFLARGDDIKSAVLAAWDVYTAGFPVDKPVVADQEAKSEHYWLVVYFGVSGSEPLEWQVRSVTTKGKEVRVTFQREGAETDDAHPYFAWAPLGKLESGTYSLELFDEGRREVTLLRRVTLPAK